MSRPTCETYSYAVATPKENDSLCNDGRPLEKFRKFYYRIRKSCLTSSREPFRKALPRMIATESLLLPRTPQPRRKLLSVGKPSVVQAFSTHQLLNPMNKNLDRKST